MFTEIFNTKREFNNKFPSKLYICSNCGELTNDRYTCTKCGWRADGLLKTWGRGYKYRITETGEEEEIFKPIELLRSFPRPTGEGKSEGAVKNKERKTDNGRKTNDKR